MSKQQAWIFIVIAAVAVGALVHMNRYEYLERNLPRGTYLIKIDHLTGQQCVTSVPAVLDDFEVPEFLELINMSLC